MNLIGIIHITAWVLHFLIFTNIFFTFFFSVFHFKFCNIFYYFVIYIFVLYSCVLCSCLFFLWPFFVRALHTPSSKNQNFKQRQKNNKSGSFICTSCGQLTACVVNLVGQFGQELVGFLSFPLTLVSFTFDGLLYVISWKNTNLYMIYRVCRKQLI